MQYPYDCWWIGQQAWIIEPPDGCGEEGLPRVSGIKIGEHTEPEKRQ
jgi:hypothetical protein